MSTQSLDSDIYDYGFILNSTALHEAAISVLVTTIYGRWRGTTTITGFIPKLVARPEYGTLYQHKGMLLQNLHRRYLYIVNKLPHLSDLEQRIPSFLNCDNYGLLTASNPDPLLDDTPTNDNKLHQVICNTFKINYFQEMDTIIKLRNRLEHKINHTLPALLPNK